jgi:hypothetical protein
MRTFPGLAFCARFLSVGLFATCLMVCAIVLPPASPAQDGSTSLQGIIEDASGARVAAAVVIVSDSARGFRLQAVADAQGAFIFGMLPPGRYNVSASAPGMATKTSSGVDLFVGGVAVVQLRLAPAAPTQTLPSAPRRSRLTPKAATFPTSSLSKPFRACP